MVSAKPPKRSSSSNSAKQGTLSFASVKRTSSATTAGVKAKSSLTPSSKRPISIRTLSGGSSVKAELRDVDTGGDGAALAKKRRLDSEDGNAVVSETEIARGAVFRSREGAENVSAAIPTPEKREKLDPGDKRWRKAYGEARSKMGYLPPEHGEGQNNVHNILRVFDLSYEYGPCAGVTRLERWERADALGLEPPPEVRDILLTKEGIEDEQYSQCVFYGEV